jgi:lysophospholipase L1-like esterase
MHSRVAVLCASLSACFGTASVGQLPNAPLGADADLAGGDGSEAGDAQSGGGDTEELGDAASAPGDATAGDTDVASAGDSDGPAAGDTGRASDSDTPGDASPAGDALSEPGPVVIVVLGASTVNGKNLLPGHEGASWFNRYAALLAAERPGSQLIKHAVNSYGTFEALPVSSTTSGRPAADQNNNIVKALSYAPDAIILNYPSADVGRGYAEAEVMQNLHTIVDYAASAGVPVWVATSQPHGPGRDTEAEIDALVEQHADTLADFGARAIDFWTPLVDAGGRTADTTLMVDDTTHPDEWVHPNDDGHARLFEAVRLANIPGAVTP